MYAFSDYLGKPPFAYGQISQKKWVSLHHYDENRGVIKKYDFFAVAFTGDDTRFHEVNKVFGFFPTFFIENDGDKFAVFQFDESVKKSVHDKICRLAKVLFPEASLADWVPNKILEGQKVSSLLLFEIAQVALIDRARVPALVLDEIKIFHENNPNKVAVDIGDDAVFDDRTGLCKKYGDAYAMVCAIKGDDAHDWINKQYGLCFPVYDTTDNFEHRIAGSLTVEPTGYFYPGENGSTEVTDFFITPHYRVSDGEETQTIVTLYNPSTGEKTKKIPYINSCNRSKVSEWAMKLGGFHVSGSQQSLVDLHKSLHMQKVPFITFTPNFGRLVEDKVILFSNGTWDMKTKSFIEKSKEDHYWFDSTGNGYFPSNVKGQPLQPTLGNLIPILRIPSAPVTPDEVFDTLAGLYKDDTNIACLLMVYGMLGHMMFNTKNQEFPILSVHGVTGSGKSTYSRIMQKIFGFDNSIARGYTRTSAFVFTLLLSSLSRFPVFFTEYRITKEDDTKRKDRMMLSLYDRVGESKGKADQTMVNYFYSAFPVIDGEEFAKDGALRSRTVKREMKRELRGMKDPDDIFFSDNSPLDGLLYSYMVNAVESRYSRYYEQCMTALGEDKGVERRLIHNVAMLYAGACAFDEERKDIYMATIEKILGYEVNDLKKNGTTTQIVNLMSRYLQDKSTFQEVYFDTKGKPELAISWFALKGYCERNRIDLSLDFDSYIGHLEYLGMRVEPYELQDRTINCVVIPYNKIPEELCGHPEVMARFKSFHT